MERESSTAPGAFKPPLSLEMGVKIAHVCLTSGYLLIDVSGKCYSKTGGFISWAGKIPLFHLVSSMYEVYT